MVDRRRIDWEGLMKIYIKEEKKNFEDLIAFHKYLLIKYGLSGSSLALGVSSSAFRRQLIREGIYYKNRNGLFWEFLAEERGFTGEDCVKDLLVSLVKKEESCAGVSRILNCSSRSVANKFRELNIPIKKKGGRTRKKEETKTYRVLSLPREFFLEKTSLEISRKVDCSDSFVRQILRREGIPFRRIKNRPFGIKKKKT